MTIKHDTTGMKLMKWAGTGFSILGACTMALFGYDYPDMQIWMFVAYTIGTILWFTAAKIEKDKPLMTMNIVFFIINITAILARI